MITLTKIGRIIKVFGAKSSELIIIKKSLSFPIPGHQFSEKFREGYWDGNLKFFQTRTLTFPYGLLDYVEKKLQKEQILYKLIGDEDKSIDWIEFSEFLQPENRDYQRDAVKAFYRRSCGIIKTPTRSGKTFIASEIIRLHLENTNNPRVFFITDSQDLFNQSIRDISGFLNVSPQEIGVLKADKFILKTVSVCMIQTIQSIYKNRKKNKSKYINLIKAVDCLTLTVIDEIHEYCESKFRINFIKRIKSQYFLSLSATPFKDNKIANLTVKAITGGIIYEISEEKLIERKVLAENKVLLLWLEHKNFRDSLSYKELMGKLIINNDLRNNVILDLISLFEALYLKTLVLFNITNHGKYISELSGKPFICGGDSMEVRDRQKKNFLSGFGKTLLASYIYKKGITLPEAQIIFNVSGGKERSLVLQIRGRGLGVIGGKNKALCIDFIDDYQKYFNKHSLSRISAYEERVGKENIVVIRVIDKDFIDQIYSFVTDFFELWD